MGVDTEGEPAFHTRKETTRERHGAAQTHLHKVSQPCYCSFILSDQQLPNYLLHILHMWVLKKMSEWRAYPSLTSRTVCNTHPGAFSNLAVAALISRSCACEGGRDCELLLNQALVSWMTECVYLCPYVCVGWTVSWSRCRRFTITTAGWENWSRRFVTTMHTCLPVAIKHIGTCF